MDDKIKQLAIAYWQDKFAKFFPKSKGPTDLEIAMFVGGLTAATPIEIYEPTYVEALEFENAKLRNALTTIKQILDIDGSNILMDAAYGVAHGALERLEDVVEEKE